MPLFLQPLFLFCLASTAAPLLRLLTVYAFLSYPPSSAGLQVSPAISAELVVDTCISVSGSLFAAIADMDESLPKDLKVCVCQKGKNTWLDANADAQVLKGAIGPERVVAILDDLLSTDSMDHLTRPTQQCAFPEHSMRSCQIASPCSFSCETNYSLKDGVCKCLPPFRECRGSCIAGECGPPSHLRTFYSMSQLVEAKLTCRVNESVCGVPGKENTSEYQCVDTSTSLENCGGCLVPHPFYEPYRMASKGQDCRTVPGSRCMRSRCTVPVDNVRDTFISSQSQKVLARKS